MRIIFTDKLSKMVAHYFKFVVDMISDMIFEIEHLFWLNTSWSSGEESNHYHGQDILAEKTLSVTLNDINSRSEGQASSSLPNLEK